MSPLREALTSYLTIRRALLLLTSLGATVLRK